MKIKKFTMTDNGRRRQITELHLIQNGLETLKQLKWDDIVIATVGSTISGSEIGSNDLPPIWDPITTGNVLDANWSIWLELGTECGGMGRPQNYCMRQSESMLGSFTITTEDVKLFNHLKALSGCTSEVGTFISLKDSQWKLNLCVPPQPVFSKQPQKVCVLWGFAHSLNSKGNFVKKAMLECSGAEIMDELLSHLNLRPRAWQETTIVIPRSMPQMSAILLARSSGDRPGVIPLTVTNLGLIGQFVEVPRLSCVDTSYGIYTAQEAVSRLLNLQLTKVKRPNSSLILAIKILGGR